MPNKLKYYWHIEKIAYDNQFTPQLAKHIHNIHFMFKWARRYLAQRFFAHHFNFSVNHLFPYLNPLHSHFLWLMISYIASFQNITFCSSWFKLVFFIFLINPLILKITIVSHLVTLSWVPLPDLFYVNLISNFHCRI